MERIFELYVCLIGVPIEDTLLQRKKFIFLISLHEFGPIHVWSDCLKEGQIRSWSVDRSVRG